MYIGYWTLFKYYYYFFYFYKMHAVLLQHKHYFMHFVNDANFKQFYIKHFIESINYVIFSKINHIKTIIMSIAYDLLCKI